MICLVGWLALQPLALAQVPGSTSGEIDTLKAEFFAASRESGQLTSIVQQLLGAGRSDAAERALAGAYAEYKNFPVGSPERQEVVDALAFIYQSTKRTIELELLRESERYDKFNAEYALMHIPGMVHTRHAFEYAQSRSSEAALALARMAVRQVATLPSDQELIRERQDLLNEWRALAALSADSRAQTRRQQIATRVGEIDTRLASLTPDTARRAALDNVSVGEALTADRALSITEAQQYLATNEALLLFAHFHRNEGKPVEYLFLWVVTRTEHKQVRISLGRVSLGDRVAGLRCGLDHTAWHGEGASRCARLLSIPLKAPANNDTQSFDIVRAHALYQALFRDVESLIAGKHLLVVPSGPLTQLPFQVLVTGSHDPNRSSNSGGARYRTVPWLVRKHAITVLPAVSSLKALRRVAMPSAATKPLLGFGNPLLNGPDKSYALLAKRARDNETCAGHRPQRVVSLRGLRHGVLPIALRNGLASLADLRAQTPLPESADELCAVARDLRADSRDLYLGGRASERQIKALSAGGMLAQYRIIHFATHGALAGELSGAAEPGLILTPPDTATEEDDGYLTAPEIAALKLDADWVILSACNTAAGGAINAEALSGIARAFFYAQARALLVSHWAVYSDAAVKLITHAVGTMAADKSIGRAEALRRAMLALIDKGKAYEAHPSYWAPFVVVGEGMAAQ